MQRAAQEAACELEEMKTALARAQKGAEGVGSKEPAVRENSLARVVIVVCCSSPKGMSSTHEYNSSWRG